MLKSFRFHVQISVDSRSQKGQFAVIQSASGQIAVAIWIIHRGEKQTALNPVKFCHVLIRKSINFSCDEISLKIYEIIRSGSEKADEILTSLKCFWVGLKFSICRHNFAEIEVKIVIEKY